MNKTKHKNKDKGQGSRTAARGYAVDDSETTTAPPAHAPKVVPLKANSHPKTSATCLIGAPDSGLLHDPMPLGWGEFRDGLDKLPAKAAATKAVAAKAAAAKEAAQAAAKTA